MPGMQIPMPFRFWDKVLVGDGCWDWQAAVDRKGYGRFQYGGRGGPHITASRMAWILTHGEIEDSRIQVCHHCDNPRCVRPDHLFLGTSQDNHDDMVSKGRGRGGLSGPECPKGHGYEVTPARRRRNGKRTCIVCERERARARRRSLPWCDTCRRYKPLEHICQPGKRYGGGRRPAHSGRE